MTTPAVSVVMAAYNGVAFIAETIDSLLAQSFTDFEVVIADDCSTDDTRGLLRRYADPRIRLVESPVNGGPVHARNLAFAHARGRYIAGLDQDDLCRPDRLARQVAYLDTYPDTVLVATSTARLKEGALLPLRAPLETTPDLIDWLMLLRNPLAWSSVMFRGDAARRLDPFERPDRLYVEDFDLYHRLRAFGRIARIDEPLTVYRIHPGGASKRYQTTMLANLVHVLQDAYAPLFGSAAQANAALVALHVGDGAPVPDSGTLVRLVGILAALHRDFVASRTLSAAGAWMVEQSYADLWRTLSRCAVRARTVRLRDALAVRPRNIPSARVGYADLLVSPMIGQLRALAAWA